MRFGRHRPHLDPGGVRTRAKAVVWIALCGLLCASGCQWAVDDADRDVYRLIENRQHAAIDRATDANIGRERWPAWEKSEGDPPDQKHAFVPHPVDSQVPASFTQPASAPEGEMEFDLGASPGQPPAGAPASQPTDTVASTQPS